MPQTAIITPLLGNEYYHVFNRGNAGMPLFYNEVNYHLFLKLYRSCVAPCCETWAYCLLPNHFHFLIKTASAVTHPSTGQRVTDKKAVGRLVSDGFRRLFLQYAQVVKEQEGIRGSVFIKPFRRLRVTEQAYLEQLIFYIHINPAKHGVQQAYKTYPFSSYQAHLTGKRSLVAREQVLALFAGVKHFDDYHDYRWTHYQPEEHNQTLRKLLHIDHDDICTTNPYAG